MIDLDVQNLVGKKVVEIFCMDSEVNRTADRYAFVKTEDGDLFVLGIASVTKPCPDLVTVAEEHGRGGVFDYEHVLRRIKNAPLVNDNLENDKKGAEDARG